jgi:hypothetical protein
MQDLTARAATLDLLRWLSSRPRTYDETMEAWRTHCPRLSIWEDALADNLVRVARAGSGRDTATVLVTDRGRTLLDLD